MLEELTSSPVFLQIVFSVAAFIITYLIAFSIIQIINKTVKDLKRKYTLRKFTAYIATIICILVIILIWIKRAASVTTIISVLGAGLTLALHQPITSIAGWLLVLFRRPYETGDRIAIGNISGDVIDIRLFYTSILEIGNWVDADQSTGRIVHCPNGKVFTEPIFNYTRGFEYIWNEIKIVVTFESNWKKAKDIILDIGSKDYMDLGERVRNKIESMSKKYMIHYEKLTPIVWTKIVDFGVELTLRYLTEARKRRSTQDAICQDILDRFNKEPDIDFAYPTYRIYKHGEGSSEKPPKKKEKH
ncbi:MAG: mechanosensitive ion channel family protein [Candidatus Aminicenantes bacterium]|nr:mechanosensitive ion channel family protein [Candidatus Aminicenantes bacterium]